jgi:hypothetical protein
MREKNQNDQTNAELHSGLMNAIHRRDVNRPLAKGRVRCRDCGAQAARLWMPAARRHELSLKTFWRAAKTNRRDACAPRILARSVSSFGSRLPHFIVALSRILC